MAERNENKSAVKGDKAPKGHSSDGGMCGGKTGKRFDVPQHHGLHEAQGRGKKPKVP